MGFRRGSAGLTMASRLSLLLGLANILQATSCLASVFRIQSEWTNVSLCALPVKQFDSTCNMHSKCVSMPVNKFTLHRLAAVKNRRACKNTQHKAAFIYTPLHLVTPSPRVSAILYSNARAPLYNIAKIFWVDLAGHRSLHQLTRGLLPLLSPDLWSPVIC